MRCPRSLLPAKLVVFIVFLSAVSPALAQTVPTDYEQYVLQLINRARANPSAEVTRLSGMTWGDDPSQVPGTMYPAPQTPALNEGLATGTISTIPVQPVAFDTSLISAARMYSNTLLSNNAFTHTFGGTTDSTRTAAAGYGFPNSVSENLAVTASSNALPISQTVAESLHDQLFVDSNTVGRGHRLNLLDPNPQQIGIGLASSSSYTLLGAGTPNAVLVTEDFGHTGGNPFLLGVIFNDNAHTGFYAPIGEGLGNVTVTATPVGGGQSFSTTTWGTGGYSLQLPAGTYNITANNGLGVDTLATSDVIGTQNVEVDGINPAFSTPEPASIGLLAIGSFGWILKCRRRPILA